METLFYPGTTLLHGVQKFWYMALIGLGNVQGNQGAEVHETVHTQQGFSELGIKASYLVPCTHQVPEGVIFWKGLLLGKPGHKKLFYGHCRHLIDYFRGKNHLTGPGIFTNFLEAQAFEPKIPCIADSV